MTRGTALLLDVRAGVGAHQLHVLGATAGETFAGRPDQLTVDVDAEDVAGVADQMGQEGGVVALANTGLEDVVAGLDGERLEHPGHDRGRGTELVGCRWWERLTMIARSS